MVLPCAEQTSPAASHYGTYHLLHRYDPRTAATPHNLVCNSCPVGSPGTARLPVRSRDPFTCQLCSRQAVNALDGNRPDCHLPDWDYLQPGYCCQFVAAPVIHSSDARHAFRVPVVPGCSGSTAPGSQGWLPGPPTLPAFTLQAGCTAV